MALAVELYFDERTEKAIGALRDEIHAAGIGESESLKGSRPHISLSVVETDDPRLLADVVSGLSRGSAPSEIRLGALSSFASGQGVLFLSPVPSNSLLELHSRFHAGLLASGLTSRPFYRPGEWIPHCTLEMGLSGAQLATAFAACWRAFTPIAGQLVAAGIVSFPPPVPHYVIPFAETEGVV